MKELTPEQKTKMQNLFPGSGLGLGPRDGKFSPNIDRCPKADTNHLGCGKNCK